MKYRGHVKNGVIVLDDASPLPEGTAVIISPVEIPLDIEGQPIDPAFLIGDLAIDMGVDDLAEKLKHDHVVDTNATLEDPISSELIAVFEAVADGGKRKISPRLMKGTTTFNAFSYLWNGSKSLALTANEQTQGSNYCRISAVLFSAFAVEAHLNHIGANSNLFVDNEVTKIKLKDKIKRIATHFEMTIDYGRRPFQTLCEIFQFRDQLAHGKTTTEERSYKYRGNRDDELRILNPEWLEKYWSPETVERVLADTRQILELIHEKAGFPAHSLYTVGSGSFSE